MEMAHAYLFMVSYWVSDFNPPFWFAIDIEHMLMLYHSTINLNLQFLSGLELNLWFNWSKVEFANTQTLYSSYPKTETRRTSGK